MSRERFSFINADDLTPMQNVRAGVGIAANIRWPVRVASTDLACLEGGSKPSFSQGREAAGAIMQAKTPELNLFIKRKRRTVGVAALRLGRIEPVLDPRQELTTAELDIGFALKSEKEAHVLARLAVARLVGEAEALEDSRPAALYTVVEPRQEILGCALTQTGFDPVGERQVFQRSTGAPVIGRLWVRDALA